MRKHAIVFATLSTCYWVLIPDIAGPFLLSREMEFGELSAQAIWPEFGYAIVMLGGYFALCLWMFGRVEKRADTRTAATD